MEKSLFATAINCMDGRVQEPVIQWVKEQFSVPYVDMITEAGPNKVLLEGSNEAVESIKARVNVSYAAHGSKNLVIAGHHNCAGNPVEREEKIEQIKKAIDVIKDFGYEMNIIGLYVNENWEVERVVG